MQKSEKLGSCYVLQVFECILRPVPDGARGDTWPALGSDCFFNWVSPFGLVNDRQMPSKKKNRDSMGLLGVPRNPRKRLLGPLESFLRKAPPSRLGGWPLKAFRETEEDPPK